MRCLNVISEALAIVLLLALAAIGASPAQLSTIPVSDGLNSWAYGINDNGYVVGAAGRGGLAPKGTYYGAHGADGGQWAGNIVTGVLYGKGHVTWLGSSSVSVDFDQFHTAYYHTTFTFATAINNAGVIVGSTIVDQTLPIGSYTDQLGYLFNGNLNGIPSHGFGPATAINNKGQIVGSSGGCSGFGCGQGVYQQRAYLLDGGRFTDLNPSGDPDDGFGTIPNSINDAGQIVGTTESPISTTSTQRGKGASLTGAAPPYQFAFLYQNGTYTDLGSLGGGGSDALDINNAGKVVGYSYLSNGAQRAFLYSNGVMTDLGTLGGTSSQANAINNQGEIVGESTLADGSEVAFLYVNGTMIDLNSFLPVGSLNAANDINNFGVIVGDGMFDGRERAFILDTTPEPATLALIGLGAILFGVLRTRCRRLS